MSITKTSFQLQELVEESLLLFKRNKKYKEVSLNIMDDLVSPLHIISNRGKLKQLLRFLLINAVEHANATRIIVSLKQLLKTEKEVLLEFTIEDNGLDYAIQKLFSYKRKLVKIRSLMNELGGKAEVSPLDGIGTTVKFLIKFPWDNMPEETTSSAHNKLAGKRILVAEDNEINQKIIAHLLRKEQIEVDLANDGKEAVELFEKNHYDLLLVDLQMPHMDGFETANYIRRKLRSTIPMVAMTASSFSNEQTRCFEVGINQYLSKPFTHEQLFQRLRYFLLNEHQLANQKPLGQRGKKDLYNLECLRLTNEDAEIVEILEIFLRNTPSLLDDIRKELKSQDIGAIIKKAAKLKGSLGSLQMQSMMQIVNEIELFIKVEDMNKVRLAVEMLGKEYETISALLREELMDLKKAVSVKQTQ